MHTKNSLNKALISMVLVIFSLISQGLIAQGVQALSPEELQRINQQPAAPAVKNNGESGKTGPKKPTFEHTETDGTSIKEYKEGGKATEVTVDTPLGTHYEMSTPSDAAAPNVRSQDVNRVPTIRMPF